MIAGSRCGTSGRPGSVPNSRRGELVGGAVRDRGGFAGDLLTDWVPDVLNAVDVRAAVAGGLVDPTIRINVCRLRVPLARRSEAVPVVDAIVRGQMHVLVERALSWHRPRRQVFSYRSAEWDYRDAYRRRQARMRELCGRADLPFVLKLDVHRFGRSLPLPALLGTSWMTEQLAGRLAELEREAGASLLPGHRWSNRLGTAVLAPVDEAVAALAADRWVRWGDDWHVFTKDEDEAEQIRGTVELELKLLGLALSEEKSGLVPAKEILASPARDVAGDPGEVWRRGYDSGDVRALRFALPRLGPHTQVSLSVPEAVHDFPGLLPRAVEYLDRAMGTVSGRASALLLLESAGDDLFMMARMLTLACRHPYLAEAVPDELLILADGCGVDGVQALAVRIATVTGRGRLVSAPSPRIAAWLSAGGDFRRVQPSVVTLL
jgi:hypothetical protein